MNRFSTSHGRARFKLGRIFVTPAALELLVATRVSIISLLARHVRGDWESLSDAELRQNEHSIAAGLRIISRYSVPREKQVLIATAGNRSFTTVQLQTTRGESDAYRCQDVD